MKKIISKQADGNYLTASIYYLIGNVIGQGVVLLSSIIFTRIMSKEAYGLVNTYAAWVLVLNCFIGLNLFITVRNAYIDYKENYHEFTSSVLLFSLIVYAIFTTIIVGGIAFLKLKVDLFVVFLATIQAISVHTINFQMAVWAMENNYKARTMLMVIPNILHTILSIVFIVLYINHQYYAKILGNVVGLLFFAIIIVIYEFRIEKPVVCKEYWKYAASISVPGIMLTLSDLILMQSDRIMLTEMSGANETAVYSLVYNIGSILIALYTAINGSWTPWFYQKVAMGKYEEVKKVQAIYIRIFTLLTVGLLTISPEVIKVLSPKTYWMGMDYVNLIVLASFLIFVYAFLTTYLMYLKKPGIIAKNTIIAAILNLILNYIMIPKYQAVGAAFATIISYVLLFFLHYISVRKYDADVFCKKEMFLGVMIIVVYSLVFYLVRHNWMIRYTFVIFIILMLLFELLKARKNNVN